MVTILQGNGDGTFTHRPQLHHRLAASRLVGGDFNGDGIPDLAIANYGGSSVTVLLGVGDGTFTAVSPSPATGSGPFAIVAGDFNNDGIWTLRRRTSFKHGHDSTGQWRRNLYRCIFFDTGDRKRSLTELWLG